ncbi:MAG: ABC transporter permease [Pirellulaceae bacterium]
MQFLSEGVTHAFRLLIVGDAEVISAAWNSVWISISAVLLATAVSVPMAIVLYETKSWVSSSLVVLFRAALNLPTVFIGLVCYAVFSRQGPLGSAELLYSPFGVVTGEFMLAVPIVVSLTFGTLQGLDTRILETMRTLHIGSRLRWITYISEARLGMMVAVLTAFSRCITELGIAMMVGGNIKFHTRTLTTATALETSRGEFARGIAMCLILLLIGGCITVLLAWMQRTQESIRE